MDTIKHKLLLSLGAISDALTCRSWENHHGVYLIHWRPDQAGNEPNRTIQSMVLKPLKLGAVKAFLVGELLTAGEKLYGGVTSGNREQAHPDDSSVTAAILPALIRPHGGWNYLWSGGNRYLLTGMIQGREADYHRRSDLQAAIRAMKTFHHFTRNLIAGGQNRWAFLRFDVADEWRKRLREMETCREMALRPCSCRGINNDWCRQYLGCWPEFYEQAREVVDVLQSLTANIPTNSGNGGDVICYHDWAYHNVIIGDSGYSSTSKAFLIDFDDIIVDRPVHDRANLISRYLRLNSWSPAAMAQILTDFERFYEWCSGELQWLWIYLAFPYEYWMLGRQYFIEKQPWSLKYYQDQWERKIACRVERKRVLERLRTMA